MLRRLAEHLSLKTPSHELPKARPNLIWTSPGSNFASTNGLTKEPVIWQLPNNLSCFARDTFINAFGTPEVGTPPQPRQGVRTPHRTTLGGAPAERPSDKALKLRYEQFLLHLKQPTRSPAENGSL
jgi:hypothetical protein